MLPHLRLPILFSILLFFLVALINAQGEYHSGIGNFSIRTTSAPDRREQIGESFENLMVFGEQFEWSYPEGSIWVASLDAWDKSNSSSLPPTDRVLEKLRLSLTAKLRPGSWSISPYEFTKARGLEMSSDTPDPVIIRVLSIDGRYYVVTLRVRERKDLPLFQAIANSFRFLTKDELIDAVIDESVPPDMSQEAPEKLPVSDAVFMGLTGSVKRVREMSESGTTTQEISFNSRGFKISEIVFNGDFPEVMTAWGWRNGDRINLQSAIRYPRGVGPKFGRAVDVSGYQGALGTDYGNRFESKYDDLGRPIERRRITNTGSLIYVEHFTYRPAFRETKTVDDSGGFINWFREKVDPLNNVVEKQTLMGDGRPAATVFYRYEFDDKGNWIVRKSFRTQLQKKPFETVKRNITYHTFANDLPMG